MLKYYKDILVETLRPAYHWTDTLSGVLSLVLPPIATLLGYSEQSIGHFILNVAMVFGSCAIFFRLGLAFFVLHDREVKRASAAENTAADLRASIDQLLSDSGPKLAATIENTIFGKCNQVDGAMNAVVLVSIRNTGDASIADNFKMSAITREGPEDATLLWLEPDQVIQLFDVSERKDESESLGDPGRTLRARDLIFNKCVEPIPKGGKQVGHIAGTFSKRVDLPGSTLSVSFTDVDGTLITCSRVVGFDSVALRLAKRIPGDVTN